MGKLFFFWIILLGMDMLHVEGNDCDIKIGNNIKVMEQFREYAFGKVAQMINFHLTSNSTDLTPLRQSPSKRDTFDPLIWSWIGQGGGHLMSLPWDYRVASLTLMTLREYDINVDIINAQCLMNLDNVCLNSQIASMLFKTILLPNIQDLTSCKLCRSSYTIKTFSKADTLGVGYKCCSIESMLNEEFTCNAATDDKMELHDVILTFSILLTFLWYAGKWVELKLIHFKLVYCDLRYSTLVTQLPLECVLITYVNS